MKRKIIWFIFKLLFCVSAQSQLTSVSNEITSPIERNEESETYYDSYGASGQGDPSDYDPSLERNIIKPVDAALAAIYGIITAVGLIANGIVFFVIFGRKEINKTVTAMYVVQLAVADSLFLLSMPIFGMQKVTRNWSFGPALCSICKSLKFFNYFAGIFFLTAMSVDRYIAVAHSITGTQLRSKKKAFITCIILWIISAAMSLPVLIYARLEAVEGNVFCRLQFPGYEPYVEDDAYVIVYVDEFSVGAPSLADDFQSYPAVEEDSELLEEYPDGMIKIVDGKNFSNNLDNTDFPMCDHDAQGQAYSTWIVVNFVVAFLIPFLIITISYILILKHLRSREASVSSMTRKNSHNTRKRVTRTVAALVICFAICWLPYHIYMLAKIVGFQAYVSTCIGIEQFVLALAFSNSALNPILYTFLGHNFKERFMESVSQTKRRWRRSSLPSATNHHTRSNSDHGNSFSKKLTNMVTFRKGVKTNTSVGSDNVFLETFSTKTKRAKLTIPMIDMRKLKEHSCSGSCHNSEQNEQSADCGSRSNITEFTRVHTGLR